MIHLRVVSPTEETEALLEDLRQVDAVLNLTVTRTGSQNPSGDTLQFDVLSGAANGVFALLRQRGIVEGGSVVAENVDMWLSDAASSAEERQSRFEALTPVWEIVEARIRSDGSYSPSWFSLLVIAGLIATVGILINSQILIVAAMVVGPEYSAMISIARALTKHDWGTTGRGLLALLVGFTAAIVAALALGAVIRATGLTPRGFELGLRPVSKLINTPNVFSIIVATLAGVVGVLSLTESRSATLIGVFISVTTIPAAADIGLSIAYGSWQEAWGSLLQLLLNVSILIVVGVIMLVAQQRIWDRVTVAANVAASPSDGS